MISLTYLFNSDVVNHWTIYGQIKGCDSVLLPKLTINRKASGASPGTIWESVELAGVARLIFCRNRLENQLGVAKAFA